MEKIRYMISDAAHLVNVESHVLRYWEDELELTIPRNEMGHRYYTKDNIKDFQKIKELKDQGYQLKAIRMILHNGNVEEFVPIPEASHPAGSGCSQASVPVLDSAQKQEVSPSQIPLPAVAPAATPAPGQAPPAISVPAPEIPAAAPAPVETLDAEDRMAQFRELMSDIVGRAIAANNDELSQSISTEVGERVLKEMDYLFREQDAAQQERYQKLDAAIRQKIRSKKSVFKKEKEKKKEP